MIRRHPASRHVALDLAWFVPPPPDWTEHALCAQVDPDLWFPNKGGSTRDAKRICDLCEVRDQCLAEALSSHIRYGVWGGLSERQRRKLEQPADDAVLPEAS